MTDMNVDWARALLREAAGIYLAHVLPAEDAEALADVFVQGGNTAVHRRLNGQPAAECFAELEAAWPIMPELNGVDMFGHLPIAGDE